VSLDINNGAFFLPENLDLNNEMFLFLAPFIDQAIFFWGLWI
jgi:hypothetical protein